MSCTEFEYGQRTSKTISYHEGKGRRGVTGGLGDHYSYLVHHVQCTHHTVDMRRQRDGWLQGERRRGGRRGGGGEPCATGGSEQLQGWHRVEQLRVNGLLQCLPCCLRGLGRRERELVSVVDTYIHNNSEHGFFPGSVCLPLCLFAGSLVVGQDRPAATG